MGIAALIPFALQALAIAFDELYFHHKRGLPRWERIGHPLDTFSLLICFLITLLAPFNETTLKMYCIVGVLSCLMVTKDEFVHTEECEGSENWLHALLFLLHPITIAMAGLIWPISQQIEPPAWLINWFDQPDLCLSFLYMQTGLIFLFLFYQIIFWNFIWDSKKINSI
jgi:hypothetical protein